MAAITSAASGLWSAGATWVGGYIFGDKGIVAGWDGTTGQYFGFSIKQGGLLYPVFCNLRSKAATGTVDATPSTTASHLFWDDESEIDVTLVHGSLESSTDDAVLKAQANWAIVGREIIGFVNVTALGGDQYRLSRLLRGLRGSDYFIDQHSINERFVLITTSSVVPFGLQSGTRGVSIDYDSTIGVITDSSPAPDFDKAVTPQGYMVIPYAPCNPVFSGSFGVDIEISWTRRARLRNGLFDGGEPPLDESVERYVVRIYDSAALMRTEYVLSPAFTYTSAMQAADFDEVIPGAGDLIAEVRQVGDYGEGFPLRIVLN